MGLRIPTLHLVALLGILYIALLASLPSNAADTPANADLVGRWQGTLDAGGTLLRLVFNVEASEDGELEATLDSPDQDTTGIPVKAVEVAGDTIRFEISVLRTVYEGRLIDRRTIIEGVWKQSGIALPLSVERAEEAPER